MPKKKQSGIEQKQASPINQPFFPEIIVSLAGAGDLIHAKYKIADKMKRPGPIYLQDEKTGKICKLAVTPKIGPLMSSRRRMGNYAFCVFNNTDFAIRPNSLVTFVIGDYRQEHIPVII
jgi:hypothetical protein